MQILERIDTFAFFAQDVKVLDEMPGETNDIPYGKTQRNVVGIDGDLEDQNEEPIDVDNKQ